MPPELLNFITTHSYLAVLFGSMVEGESVLLIASFLAYTGVLELPIVFLAAFFGALATDIGWFLAGRYYGDAFLHRFTWLRKLSSQSVAIVGRHPRTAALWLRFMFGFRIIVPFSLGKTTITTSTYILFNSLGVLIWVGVFGCLGYFFASAVEALFGRLKHYEIALVVLVALAIFTVTYLSKGIRLLVSRYFKK